MGISRDKADSELGFKVNEWLSQVGVQAPRLASNLDKATRLDLLEEHFTAILELLELDLSDDSLVETPRRLAKMYLNELCWGLQDENFPKCTTVENKFKYNDLIIEKCTIKSLCEHHFVYFGTAHNPSDLGCWVAYIPNDKVIGLSKINRIVNYFSHRPQIQERLAHQVAETLKYVLGTENVAVVIKAQHFCVLTRGIEDEQGYTITSSLHGDFLTNAGTRSELMAIVNS